MKRVQAMRSRAQAGTRREKCLRLLTGDEAAAVLHALLAAHPHLVPDALRAANVLLATVSFTALAQQVFDAVVELGLDDFDAGPRVTGYVEPSEAVWVAIERAVAPCDAGAPASNCVAVESKQAC